MTGAPIPENRRRRHLIWAIPLGLALAAGLGLLALPNFVASGYHRATIEGMASALTGRTVHIDGRLSLALLPQPQFIAGNVRITSPDNETITAASLTLDIAPLPLLRGQLLARSITLQSPHIALPWPLPGGAAAIAPPRWLTALHAQIGNGQISLGNITFSHVSADIFTGSDGAFSLSGSGTLAGVPLDLSLSFGAISAVGSTPVTLDIQSGSPSRLTAHISGTYDSSSTIAGTASLRAASLQAIDPALAQPMTGSADLSADGSQVTLSNLHLQAGAAALSGSATLALAQPALNLLLSGQNLILPLPAGAADPAFFMLPTHLALDAANTRIGGIAIPQLHGIVDLGPAGATIASLTASLPGNSTLWLSGKVTPAGQVQAKAVFTSTALSDLFGAYGGALPLPATWQEASLAGDLSGSAARLNFAGLTGNFGPARVTGTALLAGRRSLGGALNFDQLDLTPFAAMLRKPPNGFGSDAFTGDFEISADRASIAAIPLQHLLIDAAFGNQLVVRRLTASVYGGIAAASFTLSPDPGSSAQGGPQTGLISAARAILSLPSAQPVAALLPVWLQPPAAVVRAPLAISVVAAGPASGLATSASLSLGDVDITAAPRIDLIHQTAQGAFTLRHPDAIAAFKAFGLDAGLTWPGAGSIALRADMLLSATQIGFSDFVLSMGDLTGNGSLVYGPDHQVNGEIDADTLALPPIAADATLPWAALAPLQGRIGLSADRVLLGGDPILGPVSADLAFSPNRVVLGIAQASLANGVLKGDISATGTVAPAAKAPPALAARLALTGADGALLNLPADFPMTLPAGSIDAAADLTASGYGPGVWLATLTGSASLAAHSGTLRGFDLPGAAGALTARSRRLTLLRAACLAGTTPFTRLGLTGSFSSGVYSLASATLQGPAGSATAGGSIDLPDAGLALTATLLPDVPAAPQLGLKIAGSWAAPRKTTDLKQALAWKPPAAK